MEQIKEKETNTISLEEDNLVVYKTTLNDNDTYLRYFIENNYGCYNVSYLCYNLPYSYNYCKTAYDYIVSLLTNKYGEPNSNERQALSSLADMSEDDTNLLIGNIQYAVSWELQDKRIEVGVYFNSNYNQMNIELDYYAPDYSGQGYVNPNTNGL